MQYKSLAGLFILVCAVTSFAQDNKCSLRLAELPAAPELFGFHLGMSMDQVKERVPQVVFGKPSDFGVSQISISPDFDPRIDKASLAGIRTVSLDFLDGHLSSLWLGFDGSFKWRTVPDFVQGISQSLHLPNDWEPWKLRGQQLNCADFQMTVSIVAEGPSFHVSDQTAARTVAARRAELEEAASEEGESDKLLADRQTMVYYPEGCQPTSEVREENKVTFKTREEAEKAGYKVAKACH
jgi:hypothetical protein